ncbi:MAG TPA: hypothetical protein VNV15_05890 [Opitutaceae bacterium]|jgi:hypothetical protein|nr:hypothetical protein [Opitutaceae bacterium]
MKSPSISDIVGIIGVGSVVVTCLSISYEYGYAHGIGVPLADLSLGVEDFTKSAVAWVPALFLGFVIIFLLETSTSFIEGGKTEQELIEGSKNPGLIRKIKRSPDFLYLGLGLIVLTEIILNPPFIQPLLPSTYAFVWLCLAGFLMTRESIRRKFNPRLVFSIYIFVGLILLVHAQARNDAAKALNRKPNDVVELTSGVSVNCDLLRRYSNITLIIRAGEKEVTFLNESEIRSVKRANP